MVHVGRQVETLLPLSLTVARVQAVLKPITKKVESKDGNHQCNARRQREPWAVLHVAVTAAQHAAPTGSGRLDPEAEEAQCTLCNDCAGHLARSIDDQRSQDVW